MAHSKVLSNFLLMAIGTKYMSGNTYHIYEQNIHAMDMFMHLQRWMTVLEHQLGRSLEPDDHLFLYIPSNGLINPKQAMTHEVLQGLLSSFTQQAGLKKHYTTHCLRRGGAQYRFIYAPIGQRWSLMRIRWWGCWAEGEDVSFLFHHDNLKHALSIAERWTL